jgi:hypothetical protein
MRPLRWCAEGACQSVYLQVLVPPRGQQVRMTEVASHASISFFTGGLDLWAAGYGLAGLLCGEIDSYCQFFYPCFDPHEPADAIDVNSLETIIAFGLQPLLELIVVRRMPPRMTSCLHANNEEKGNIDSKRLERHALKDCKPHQIACQIEPLSKKAITDKTPRAGSSPY